MKTLERAIWCLSGVVLVSAASWAQDRGVGREAAARRKVGSGEAMEDRVRSIRLNQYSSTRFLLQLQSHLQQTSPESFEGDNYINLIPLVINEDGVRTNVGLNNFSRFSVHKGPNPAASVAIADQMYKFPTLVESQGTPDNLLLIQSSVRAGWAVS